jgi:hypothetical protein
MIDPGDMQVFFMLMLFLVTSFLVSTRMMTESRGHVVPTHDGQRMQWIHVFKPCVTKNV